VWRRLVCDRPRAWRSWQKLRLLQPCHLDLRTERKADLLWTRGPVVDGLASVPSSNHSFANSSNSGACGMQVRGKVTLEAPRSNCDWFSLEAMSRCWILFSLTLPFMRCAGFTEALFFRRTKSQSWLSGPLQTDHGWETWCES
jgi:hypothetical protein